MKKRKYYIVVVYVKNRQNKKKQPTEGSFSMVYNNQHNTINIVYNGANIVIKNHFSVKKCTFVAEINDFLWKNRLF